MNLKTLVWKEMRQRPTALAASGLAILLSVAALVTIRHVTSASENQVARKLENLGANVLILPKAATLQNYYAADMHGETLPESHVSRILLEGLPGVEKLSPKLCASAKLGERDVTLTGILPQSEFQSSAAWRSVPLFSRKHVGCKKVRCAPKTDRASPQSLATERTIEQLKENQVVIGADVHHAMRLAPGDEIKLFGETFQVLAALPTTGTIDDSRVFAHLHTVQRLTHVGEVVSAIEVLGCCDDVAGALVRQLGELLPDAKVVTITHVVEAQVSVNRLMSQMSLIVAAVLVIVGGGSVATAISANVRERRREIATLMALGATPGYAAKMFLLKALWLGLGAGAAGAAVGLALAMGLGPQWAGTDVPPLPWLLLAVLVGTLGVCFIAAYLPARLAARLDPSACLQEV